MPAVSSRSFTPYGMPCSGPRYFPAAISASACFACASAASFVSVMTQRSFGSNCSIRCEIDVRQALGGERLLLDPARQLRHRRKRDVGVARRAAEPASLVAAHEVIARRARALAREHRVPTRRRRDVRHRARPSAARRAVRAAAPSTAASSLPPSRARPALIVTCASFSASANVAADTGRARHRRRAERRRRARRRRRRRTLRPAARRGMRPPHPAAPIGAVIRNCLRVFMS